MQSLPPSVAQYLSQHTQTARCNGYVHLNNQHLIEDANGHLAETDLSTLDKQIALEQQLPIVAGLLAAHHTTTTIHNVHIDQDSYFDVHLFSDDHGNWIVFVDTTEPGVQLQKEQQQRLNKDFAHDKRKTGN